MLRPVEEIPSTAHQPEQTFSFYSYTVHYRMFLNTFEARNRYYSNRILIHIWSALPSLTVWSEFASVCQSPPLNAQPIGTLSQWNDLWLVKVSRYSLDFFKAWKQSHEEVQKSSYLSEHLNYNMLKDYYGIFAQWCQKYTAYWSFNALKTLVVYKDEFALTRYYELIFEFVRNSFRSTNCPPK